MSPERWDLLRRLILANAVVVLFIITVMPYVERIVVLLPASDWGSDWRWLEDGLKRLAAGLPLTRPEYVTGPWSQFAVGAQIPTYTWSLHPPYSAVLYQPFMLVPAAIRAVTWAAVMAATLAAAVAVAWPRRLWWGTGLLIATILLRPPINGAWLGLIDQIHYANPNAIVALGVALVWIGRRRGSTALMAAGLVLASVKILPAATLGLWLLAARDRPGPARKSVVVAGGILAVLTVIVLVQDPGAIYDMIRSQLNMVPWPGATNFAPQVRLAPLLGPDVAKLLSWVVGLGVPLLVLVRRLDGPGGFLLAVSASLLLTPQLWANWFVVPAVAVLATAPEWRIVRAVDRRLSAGFPASDPA
ncbi:MAG: hypothetical protein HYX55_06895 [Chloroflexi bacterium]|nr:hypothetical protein [Chloroflexota bacterium]